MIDYQNKLEDDTRRESEEWWATIQARIAELRKDKGAAVRQLRQHWDETVDPEEAKETLRYLMQAIDEDRSPDRQLFTEERKQLDL